MAETSARWREPASLIPLRWGLYRPRLIGGTILIVSGGMAVAGSSPYAIMLLIGGTIAHVLGWWVLPATGWRRIFAFGPSTLAVWLLLSGPRFLGVLVLAYVAWLLVRQRPLISYATVIFVLAGAIVLGRVFPDYRDMLPAAAIEFAVLVAAAWAARLVHRATWQPWTSPPGARSSTANPQRPESRSP